MAITSEADGVFQEMTFSAATTPPTVTAAQQVTLIEGSTQSVNGQTVLPTQFLDISVTHSVSGGSATLVFFWADDNSVGSLGAGKIKQETVTVSASTTRQSHNTGAGDYVCTVACGTSGTSKMDTFPCGPKNWPKLYCACTVLSGGTITVRVAQGRAI